MRILCGILCLLMLLFIGVQINDPDGAIWMVIYAIPALWAGVAAWRPALLRGAAVKTVFWICLVAAAAATVYYWPKTPGWWRSEVWWEVETAREGMGMMIVVLVLLAVLITVRRSDPGTARL